MDYSKTPEWIAYEKLMKERPEAFGAAHPESLSAEAVPGDKDCVLRIITDPVIVGKFAEENHRKIGVVYASPYNTMVVDLVQDHTGRMFCYDRLLQTATGKAVCCLTICHGKFVLLEQYRHSMQGIQYAFCRGFGENGIAPADNARKEISEELGASVISIERLGTVYADSGISGNGVEVFCCQVEDFEEKTGYEEIRKTVTLTADEIREWFRSGKITDGYTMAAMELYRACKGE